MSLELEYLIILFFFQFWFQGFRDNFLNNVRNLVGIMLKFSTIFARNLKSFQKFKRPRSMRSIRDVKKFTNKCDASLSVYSKIHYNYSKFFYECIFFYILLDFLALPLTPWCRHFPFQFLFNKRQNEHICIKT